MALGAGITSQALADYQTAPISDKLRAMLGFLEKVTLTPEHVGGADAEAVLATGVSRPAFVDALYVMFLFNVYDRLADTLGWEIPAEGSFQAGARFLLKRGYS